MKLFFYSELITVGNDSLLKIIDIGSKNER